MQVDFDPAQITFEQLLDVFWLDHDPCGAAWSTQYKTILFHTGEAQRRAAEQSARDVAQLRRGEVVTELVELDRFWVAEDYHQKYALRRHTALAAQVRAMFASEAEFRDSPVTAKLNAWCAGDLDRQGLDAALRELGYRVQRTGAGIERTAPAAGAAASGG